MDKICRTISFGKIAYAGKKKINEVTVDLELRYKEDGPEFSACCDVWNSRHTDIVMGGQCLDDVLPYMRGNALFKEIVELWKKHHLNFDAGTPEQMQCIREHKDEINEEDGWYIKELNLLKKYGLDVVKWEGKDYKYGTAWIYRPIPEPDLSRIKEIINGNINQ